MINTIITILLFFILPAFCIYKLYSLLAGNMKFKREQFEKRNNKEIQFLDLQILELQQKMDFYSTANEKYKDDQADHRQNRGGNHGNNQKYRSGFNKSASRQSL